jgi:glycogen phosphorylase
MTLGTAGDAVDVRTGLQADALRQAILDHLRYSVGRPASVLTPAHYYRALALAVRDRVQQRWFASTQTFFDLSRKVVCYLSAEFLMGPRRRSLRADLDRRQGGLGHRQHEVHD